MSFTALRDLGQVLRLAENLRDLPSLEALFDQIEARGWKIATDVRLRLAALVVNLHQAGLRFGEGEEIAPFLVGVLARSKEEAGELTEIIHDWRGLSKQPPETEQEKAAAAAQREFIPPKIRASAITWRRVALAIGASLLIAMIAIPLYIAPAEPKLLPPQQGPAQVGQSSAVILSNGFVESPSDDSSFLLRLMFALGVVAPGYFLLWRWRSAQARLAREYGNVDVVESFRLEEQARPRWFQGAGMRRVIRDLKRSRWRTTDRIDVRETLACTVRNAGMPVIRFSSQREQPLYVICVDNGGERDHADIFIRTLQTALTAADVTFARYDFFGRPAHMKRRRAGDGGFESVPFSVVASRHSGERLIVVGSGTDFFQPPGIRRDETGGESIIRPGTPFAELQHLREFPTRFLVTAVPRSRWGERERQLLALGFTLVTADAEGVSELAARFKDGGEEENSDQHATSKFSGDSFLERLEREAFRYSSDIPPPQSEINALVSELRIWAGDRDSFALLAAISAFPKIDSRFTLVLAKAILAARSGAASDVEESAFENALFNKLSLLPWLRQGRMPDWLRVALVNAVDEKRLLFISQVQLALLARLKPAGDQTILSADDISAYIQIAQQKSKAQISAIATTIVNSTAAGMTEHIFLTVLSGERPDPRLDVLRPEAPDTIRDHLEEPDRLLRRAAGIGLGAIGVLMLFLPSHVLSQGKSALAAAFDAISSMRQSITSLLGADMVFSSRYLTIGLVWLGLLVWGAGAWRNPGGDRQDSRLIRASFAVALLALVPAIASFGSLVPSAGIPVPSGPLIETFSTRSTAADLAKALLPLAMAFAAIGWTRWIAPVRFRRPPLTDMQMARRIRSVDGFTGLVGAAFIGLLIAFATFGAAISGSLFAEAYSWTALIRQGLLIAALSGCGSILGLRTLDRWFGSDSDGLAASDFRLTAAAALLPVLLVGGTISAFDFRPDRWSLVATALLVAAVGLWLLAGAAILGVRRSTVASQGLAAVFAGACFAATYPYGIGENGLFGGDYAFLGWALLALIWGVSAPVFYVLTNMFFAWRQSRVHPESSPSVSRWAFIVGPLLCAAAVSINFVLVNAQQNGGFSGNLFESGRPAWGQMQDVVGLANGLGFLTLLGLLWPSFRFAGPGAFLNPRSAPAPVSLVGWLRARLNSPWYCIPVLWFVALSFQIQRGTLSYSYLALPIAVLVGARFGRRSFLPLLIGGVPLALHLAFGGPLTTMGGFWPLPVILFWARFAGDPALRQRLLRRERLSPFDLLLVAPAMMLSIGGSDLVMPVDPEWLIVSVSLIVGLSRMRRYPFALVVLAGFALNVHWSPSAYDRGQYTLGIPPETLGSSMLALYFPALFRRLLGLSSFSQKSLWAHLLRISLVGLLAIVCFVGIYLSSLAGADADIKGFGDLPVISTVLLQSFLLPTPILAAWFIGLVGANGKSRAIRIAVSLAPVAVAIVSASVTLAWLSVAVPIGVSIIFEVALFAVFGIMLYERQVHGTANDTHQGVA